MDYIIFNWNTIFWGVVALLLSFALGTMVLIAFVATLPPTFLQTPIHRWAVHRRIRYRVGFVGSERTSSDFWSLRSA